MRILPFRLFLTASILLSAAIALPAQDPLPTADEALKRLKEGNDRFVKDKLAAKDTRSKRRAELIKGQQPFAVVLACADSRVAPELIFDQCLGDLFVLRVAGNITDRGVVGSIEYAVEVLKAPLLVVLGHEECGAVKAALDGKPLPGDLGWLVKQIHVGKDLPSDKKQALSAAIQSNALHQAQELMRKSTIIKDLVSSKRVRIAEGVYSLTTGQVNWVDVPAPKAK